MKYICTLLLLFPFILPAQTYYPFPTDSAEWSVEHGYYGFPGAICSHTVHYGIIGDTLISGNTYSKIYENNYWNGNMDTTFNPSTANYFLAMREDAFKKIWVRRPSDTADVILYDFSLNVGDTFCFDYAMPGVCSTVDAIDSVMVDGSYRRTITITASETQIWMVGIGNMWGLFDIMYTGNIYTHIRCHSQNGSLIYAYPGWTTECHCDNSASIDENMRGSFSVSPNPFHDKIEIESAEMIEEIIIFDLAGKLVLRIDKPLTNTIDLGDLENGMFFVTVKTESGFFSEKIVKLMSE
jgi:hypothetical protein